MKKGFVALLVALAVVVLVSPAIVGRLAEKSVDENLEWAATESQDVVVTSQGFDRGWFSSEGQHRVEIRDGELRNALLELVDDGDSRELPVLLIDTRLDHGLVPVASMSRDKGSLMPGLGNAISTLSLEFGNGSRFDLPGTIYSQVGLTGDLRSNFVLEAGEFSQNGETARWGAADILLTTHPSGGNVAFSGEIESLSLGSYDSDVSIGKIEFEGDQRPTKFGFSVGEVSATVASATLPSAQGAETIGPLVIDSEASLDGDRVSGRSAVTLNNLPFGGLGPAKIVIDVTLTDMDGASLGNLSRALKDVGAYDGGDAMMYAMQPDLQRLLSSGFELRFDQIDVTLPQGALRMKLNVALSESDLDRFTWTSALLALDATFDLSVPAELVEIATAMEPQLNAAIGMGFLKMNGDVYEMEAAFQKGLLTVNGAPMPIPISGVN